MELHAFYVDDSLKLSVADMEVRPRMIVKEHTNRDPAEVTDCRHRWL
jgi:hypothetical protein